MTSTERITGVVLAGGHGVRLGRPKAGVLLQGRPLLEHVLGALVHVAADIIVVRSALLPLPAIHHPGVEVLVDEAADEGPLRALATAFTHVQSGLVAAVGCDMPFINPTLILKLATLMGGHDATVPVVEGRKQPLHAVYRASVAAVAATNALGAANRSVVGFLDRMQVRWVDRPEWETVDPTGQSFFNINTPEDLELAASLT
jgi:molybdopterin-guanine dinucleotide biosynthesis protein A